MCLFWSNWGVSFREPSQLLVLSLNFTHPVQLRTYDHVQRYEQGVQRGMGTSFWKRLNISYYSKQYNVRNITHYLL